MSSYCWLIITVLLSTSGQLLVKIGSMKIVYKQGLWKFVWSLFNTPLLIGGACVFTAPMFYFVALRNIELSTAYGFMALSFVLVMVGSAVILRERLHFFHFIGIGFVFFGVILIGA